MSRKAFIVEVLALRNINELNATVNKKFLMEMGQNHSPFSSVKPILRSRSTRFVLILATINFLVNAPAERQPFDFVENQIPKKGKDGSLRSTC